MKKIYEDDFEEQQFIDRSIIFSFLIYSVIAISFFFLLGQKSQSEFGFTEIALSLSLASLAAVMLAWTRRLMSENLYLGVIVGFLIIVSFVYSMNLKYEGPYSTIFTAAGIIVYLLFIFFYYKQEIRS